MHTLNAYIELKVNTCTKSTFRFSISELHITTLLNEGSHANMQLYVFSKYVQ